MTTDLDLISRIKTDADSGATIELINRHSGVYFDVIGEYAWSPKIKVEDFKDDRMYNMFEWIMKYDPNKGMKFGSYVGQETRFMCLDIINRGEESVQLASDAPNTDTDTQGNAEKHIEIEEIRQEARQVEDPRFWKIFKLRFDAKKPRSWRQVGDRLNMSHEGARKCFMKHLGLVREHMGA